MIEQKKNDWLATLFFSPDKTPQDLANIGITTDNSSLQDRDYYKNIPEIQSAFKTDSGAFDENKFNKFYQDALELYNYADNEKVVADLTNFYNYDELSNFAPIGSNVTNDNPIFTRIKNPERRSRGLVNFREASAPTMSVREVGQQNKIFNVDTGKFEDWTPNDWGGLSAITRPTLVLAQWDEDGVHEVDGQQVAHRKGDLKFNEHGDPYYETLGNRSTAGKDILHIADTLSIDGSKWNKYDIFDSDGLDKSVFKTVVSTGLKIAPYFIPYVKNVYGIFNITTELGKLLPTLYKSIESIATGDISESKSAQKATNLAAYFSRFDSSLSDKGRSTFFNIENLGQVISDSSSQLLQQQLIGKLPLVLKQLSKSPITPNTVKWGQGISLAYMAGTSSIEAYDAFKQAGASDRVAGLGMISVMGAMYGLMNQDYFKKMWFEGSYLDTYKTRGIVWEAAKQIANTNLSQIEKEVTKKGAAKWVDSSIKFLEKKLSSMKPGDLAHDALNEGVEETIEEVTTDAVKAFYKGLNMLGIVDQDTEYNFGITPEDMLSRYFTSFAGGTIGGAVFSLHRKFDKNNKQTAEFIKDQGTGLTQMIYLIRNGKTNEIRNEINRLYKSGKLGSTNLSGSNFEVNKDGEINYKPASDGDSQNDVIHDQLNFYVDRIENLLKEENLDYSDDELQRLTTENIKFEGWSVDQVREALKQAQSEGRFKQIENSIINNNLHSRIFDDWAKLTDDIVKTKVELETLLTPDENEPKTPKDIDEKIAALKNNAKYQELKTKLDNLRAQRDSILQGEKNDYYMGQLLFAANPVLVEGFYKGFGLHNYTRYKYNKDYNKLSDKDKAAIKEEYAVFSANKEKNVVLDAFDLFYDMNEKLAQSLTETSQKVKDSSEIFKNTTQNLAVENFLKHTIKTKTQERDKLIEDLPEGVTTSEDIDKLNNEIASLEQVLKSSLKFSFGFINRALTQKGSQLLKRPQGNVDQSLAFYNYAQSYKNFLHYIKDNGLYLELVDSDLMNLLQGWLVTNGLYNNTYEGLSNRILNYLDSRGAKIDLDSEEEKVYVDELISRINNLLRYVEKGELKNIITEYNAIKSLSSINDEWLGGINNVFDTNITIDDILSNVLPNIADQNFIDYITEINDIHSQIPISPVYDLLEKATSLSGLEIWNIVDLIKQEQTNFLNSKSFEDYLIQNHWDVTRLKETLQLTNSLISIIQAASGNGFNANVNDFRNSLGKELLPVLENENLTAMLNDLSVLGQQLTSLIDIAEKNQQAKLREQKDISINMRNKFFEALTNENFNKKFIEKFGIDLVALSKNISIPDKPDEKNLKEFEAGVSLLETQIYQEVGKLNLTNEQIAEKLISLFDADSIISGKPTQLSKNPETEITDLDKLVYLATIIGVPAQNYYNDLNEVISKDDFNFAPIFPQEYAARIAYANIINQPLFNSIVTKISSLAQANSNDAYIKTKTPLRNILTIFGGAGVGKTKVVDYIIDQIFKKDSQVILTAPTSKQVQNLKDSLKEDYTVLTKSDLIQEILGRSIEDSDIIQTGENTHITLDPKVTVQESNRFGDAKYRILYLDEVGLYDRIELELISKWANKNNVTVIATGDYEQNPTTRIVKFGDQTKEHDSGILDTFTIKTPDLVAPLRPNNIAKQQNYIRLRQILDNVFGEYFKNTALQVSDLSDIAKQLLNQNKVQFKWFDVNGDFGGEKFIKSTEIRDYVDKVKKLSDDWVIITDHPEKYKDLDKKHVVHYKVAQGDEHDFIILDKNFNVHGENDFYKLRDIYTLTQRSRRGTIIVADTLSELYTDVEDSSSSGSIEISDSQLHTFKDWRIDCLSKIPKERIELNKTVELSIGDEVKPIATEKPVDEKPTDQKPTDSTETTKTENVVKSEKPTKIEESKPDQVVQEKVQEEVAVKPTTETHTETTANNSEAAPKEDISKTVTKTEPEQKNKFVHPADFNTLIGNVHEYIEFSKNGLVNFLNSDQGINKVFNVANTDKLKRLTNLLRTYYCNGVYKEDWEKNKNTAINLARKLFRDRSEEKNISLFLNVLQQTPRFYIIPYNNRGLFVSRVTIDGKEYDIPLFLTDPIIGEYFGDIEINTYIDSENFANETEFTNVEFKNFKDCYSNSEGLVYCLEEPVVLSASEADLSLYDQSQRDWIRRRGKGTQSNNGRTFIVLTSNPWLSKEEILENIRPVETTDKNGRVYSWTIQRNPQITLKGVNKIITFQDIIDSTIKYDHTKKSIVNGQRIGQILGLLYNDSTIDPKVKERINKRIEYYLKDNNGSKAILINDTEACYTYEEVINAIKKYQNGELRIGFTYKNPEDGKLYYLANGEEIIKTTFVVKSKSSNTWVPICNKAFIAQVDEKLKKSTQFKLGIYGKDIKANYSINDSLYYQVVNPGTNYMWNIQSVFGNSYSIDSRKINITEDVINKQKQINELNKQLKALGINYVITDLTDLTAVENNINANILSKVNSPSFKTIRINGNTIEWVDQYDFTPMITNYLNVPKETIRYIPTKVLKFKPFFVSSQGQTSSYVIENINGDWKIREFPLLEEYIKFREKMTQNSKLIKQDENLLNYITKLINNEKISMKEAQTVSKVLAEKIDIFRDIKQQINEYLMIKLENNEC